jgi:putative ABC transport system permease protein
MTILRRLASIVDWMLRRDTAERRLDDELATFIQMAAAEKIREGVPPEEARRLAHIELGGVESVKEQVRTQRHGGSLDEIGRDVRYAFRVFGRNPSFTFVIVMTLALGIGANTAIFSLIDALMLRWLPVHHPQELVQVDLREPGQTGPPSTLSYPIARALATQHDAFAGAAGFSSGVVDVGAAGAVRRVPAAWVTGDFYPMLGLTPVEGRLLRREDDEAGAPLVAVISYGYWEREFARNPAAVGQVLKMNDLPVTIVGVSPRGFVGATVGLVADITLPVAAMAPINPSSAALLEPGNFWLRVLVRPAPGLSAAEALARVNVAWPGFADSVIAPRWSAKRRQAMRDSRFAGTPGGTGETFLRSIYEKPLYVLMAVVGLVLLIACANVASLLLARTSSRQREIAVRLAIGAGRGRIVRQLLIESAVLSLIGAACGVALAAFATRGFVDLMSEGPVRLEFDLSPNLRVLGFTTSVALITSVLFGIAPALQSISAKPVASLKEDARTSTSRTRLLPILITVQVALALVLVAGAGLFVRTLQNLQHVDAGFKSDGVLVADLNGRRTTGLAEAFAKIQALPGVRSAAVATQTPLDGWTWSEPAVPTGQQLPERDTAIFIGADPGYFDALGIRLLAGRAFSETDRPSGPFVAIVNEVYAQKYFAAQNPVGHHLSAEVRGRKEDLEIVGLASNVSASGLRRSPPAIVYVAHAQLAGNNVPMSLIVRASGPLSPIAASIQQTLQPHISGASIEVKPLSAQVGSTIIQERMMAALAGAFGVLALVLVCVGLYGLLAYTVAQRTKEIGIRMALGARESQVVRSVLIGGARLVVIGIALGLPLAWYASRWIGTMLYGLTPMDPVTIAGAMLTLTVAAELAAYFPARRASRVDPLVALRHD